ncbi:hypothetical protein DSUL_20115 [Desulfovibrionales bacterium]
MAISGIVVAVIAAYGRIVAVSLSRILSSSSYRIQQLNRNH